MMTKNQFRWVENLHKSYQFVALRHVYDENIYQIRHQKMILISRIYTVGLLGRMICLDDLVIISQYSFLNTL